MIQDAQLIVPVEEIVMFVPAVKPIFVRADEVLFKSERLFATRRAPVNEVKYPESFAH